MNWRARARQICDAIDRRATDRAILVAGWLWFLVYAYPGYMSYDSTFQLAQARHIEPITEWHPPVMTIIWRLTDDVIAGPFPMLVIQSVVFVVGSWVLLSRVMASRAAAIVAVVLLLMPQNIVVMSVIWKDAQMAAFLIAGIAALFSKRRGWRIAGYFFLFLASAVRYNGPAATLSIVLLQFGYGTTMSGWRRHALAVGAWLGITALAFGSNAVLVEKHVHPWETSVAIVDIAGTIRWGPPMDDAEIHRLTPGVPWAKAYPTDLQKRIRNHYRPENHFLIITQEPDQIFDYPAEADLPSIASAWRNIVFAHPYAYLRHRLGVFGAQLSDRMWIHSAFTDVVYDELLGHRATHSKLQAAWIACLQWFSDTFSHKISLYFAIAIALLPMARRNRLALVLLSSGILYQLGLVAVGPGRDYRYAQWMIVTTMLAAVVVFMTRLRSTKDATERLQLNATEDRMS